MNTNEINHVAIIMDGNGRWAKKRGLPRTKGHEEGCKRIIEIFDAVKANHIYCMTLYAFSTENWNRPKSEITLLFRYLRVVARAHFLDSGCQRAFGVGPPVQGVGEKRQAERNETQPHALQRLVLAAEADNFGGGRQNNHSSNASGIGLASNQEHHNKKSVESRCCAKTAQMR